MGMAIGSSQSDVMRVTVCNRDGSRAGAISIRKASSASKKKLKRLQYNFKEISTQLMLAKTSAGASQVAARARRKVAALLRNKKSGEYDEGLVDSAIAHAKRIEQIARRRVKHLKQEEAAQGKGNDVFSDDFEDELEDEETESMEDISELADLSEEELRQLMEDLQQEMQESEEEMTDNAFREAMAAVVPKDMSAEDVDRLKKRHRSAELREIAEADMKYLKAVFQKLQAEKQNGSFSMGSSGGGENGVALAFSGMDVPVETAAAPVAAEGAVVDASV